MPASKDEKRLRHLFARLNEADRDTLLSFAEFLYERGDIEEFEQEPVILPRPPKESVIQAIKRLSGSYPMLNKAAILNEASALMSQHIMSGREAVEVIDELEEVFARHYQELRDRKPR